MTRCYVGVNLDTAAVPDGEVMIECLRAGFDEVLTLPDAADPNAVREVHRASPAPGAHSPNRVGVEGQTLNGCDRHCAHPR
jgi:hypothetical protein